MLVPGSANPLLLRTVAAPAAGGISRSLRFNSADSAYLSRTPASAGNRTTWTWAGWVKKTVNNTSEDQCLFGGYSAQNDTDWLEFGFGGSSDHSPADKIYWTTNNTTSGTTAVYRDNSAWYHIVATYDGSNLKFYVNNELVLTSAKTGNLGVNVAGDHAIGKSPRSGVNRYFNGYLADIYFIDGAALTPSSFTETDATTGQLIPKAYTGSYGTNGFRLEFADNSSNTATTLGKDTSGNGNNWTPNNLSVTAGVGNDSLVDVPTNGAQTDTGVGGEVRGNYATLNPLVTNSTTTLSNGNLDATGSEQVTGFSSIVPSSGKWYLEITLGTVGANSFIGLAGTTPIFNSYCVYGINGFGFANTGWGSPSSTVSGTGAAGDVIGLAFDVDAKTLQFYKNGSSIGTISAFTYPQNWSIGFRCNAAVSTPWVFNFGQRPFAYTAPSGFKALCTANLPAPVVTKPSTVFDVKLYTGNNSTNTISGLGFSPDFVWIKSRSSTYDNRVFDTVRPLNARLFTSATSAEVTSTVNDNFVSFNSDGFTLGTATGPDNGSNQNGSTFVAWTWDAGSSTVTNTQGSITSSVRANATAGFSVVSWSANNAANQSIGHGLGVTPAFIIHKNRTTAGNWNCWFTGFSNDEYINLNGTGAKASTGGGLWYQTPTSSVFYIGFTGSAINSGTDAIISYCFAPVVGYSSFGSYTGNGSTDGPFVFTGMRPRWVLVKRTSSTGNWNLFDTSRSDSNLVNKYLLPNDSGAEFTFSFGDILSNGFKLRDTSADWNASGSTYVYAAFAEAPINYSRAR
jgi:hypothetical protein